MMANPLFRCSKQGRCFPGGGDAGGEAGSAQQRVTTGRYQRCGNALTPGFIMVEIMLALSLFGICVVGLMKALTQTTRFAVESQMDSMMMLRLQSRITEISKLPDLTPLRDKQLNTPPDGAGVWTETLVQELKDYREYKNEEGQEVTQMYRIYVKAFYYVGWKAEPEMQDAEVWRYLPLYKSSGASAATPTPAPVPTP